MSGFSPVQEARARREARAAQNKTAGGVATPAPLQTVKAETPTCLDFLAEVLSDQGHYCLFLLPERRHVWTDSVEGLAGLVDKYKDRQGIYFATSSFKDQTGRVQANVLALKAFRLDLDAGEHKHTRDPEGTYATQEDARQDLQRFSTESGLTPSYVISSGEGLHVYYVLEKSCPPSDWQPVAEAFKRVCTARGLRADPSVTADSARVLRPVGTLHKNGKSVEVLEATGKVYTLAEFAGRMGTPDENGDPLGRPVRAYDLSINTDVLTQHDDAPADFELIQAECEAVRWAANPANQPKVSEPYWRGLLGIVKHCVGAEGLAHQVSKHHPDYDPTDTASKLDAWGAGPTTCEYFAALNPSACAACKHARGGVA